MGLVFDPYDLSHEITPDGIVEAIADSKFSAALVMSLRLNDVELITRSVESIPIRDGEKIPHKDLAIIYNVPCEGAGK